MQTITFARNIQDITKKLKVNELSLRLDTILSSVETIEISEEVREDLANIIFEVREGFHTLQCSPGLKVISDSLGLDTIFQPKQLALVLTIFNTVKTNTEIFSSPQYYQTIQTLLANIKALAAFTKTIDANVMLPKLSPRGDLDRLMEIEIVDFDGFGLSIKRLGMILESLHRLHSYITRISEDKNAKLTIAFMDSGEDFLLGIQSSVKTIELMKALLNQFWQKIRFKAPEEIDRTNESLSKGLTIFQHISRQEKNGVFDVEQGAKLRNAIIDEMLSLTGLGVIIKEYEIEEKFERRKLLIEKKDIRANPSKEG